MGGGIALDVDFHLHDPNNDGKVTLPELEADLASGNIFDASGALTAYLDAYVEINLFFVHKRWDFQIASVTLAQIGETPTPPDEEVPQLGTVEGGVLRLNIGPYSADRLYGDISDSDATVAVTQDGANNITVTAFGDSQTFPASDNITEIVATGGTGADNITVNVHNNVAVDLTGGTNADTLTVKSAGNVTVSGGAGNDRLEADNVASAYLEGGDGNDTLIVTGSEPATLDGGAGNDILYGGSGTGQQLIGDDGDDTLYAGSGAGQVLHGNDGNDILVGGDGANQQLFGDDGNDSLYGGTGNGQTLDGGTGNDLLCAGEADGQVLFGDSGNDVLQVGWTMANGLPQADIPSDQTTDGTGHGYEMHGGSGDDTIYGGAGNDTLYGETGNDQLYGEGGNDLLYGGFGNDVLHGGQGDDTLYGGLGDDTLLGDAGADQLHGDAGANVLWGDFGTPTSGVGASLDPIVGLPGDDTFYAGIGQDVMYGEAGEDTFQFDLSNAAAVNADMIDGGSGRDTVVFNGGNYYTADLTANTPAPASGGSLTVGTTYYWVITAITAAGETGISNELSLTPTTAGKRTASLSWLQYPGATGYKIYRSTQSGEYSNALVATISSGSTLTYNDTGAATTSSSPPVINDDIRVKLVDAATRTYDLSDQYVSWLRDQNGNVVGEQVLQNVGTIRFQVPTSVEIFRVAGQAGDDRIQVDPTFTQRMEIDGGDGNDTLIGGSGTNTIWGGAGNDLIVGGNDGNEEHGGDGNDTLIGGTGSDALFGEGGDNTLLGVAGSDFLYGGDGTGNNLIIGGLDWVQTVNGIIGQTAQDYLTDYENLVGDSNAPSYQQMAADYQNLVGGALPVSLATITAIVQLLPQYGVPILNDTSGDIIYGENDPSGPADRTSNVIFGSAGDDVIFAGGGNDWVNGRAGLDVIDGGAGNDTLNGGGGYDRIFGDAGNDLIYATRWDISAFSPVQGDDTYTSQQIALDYLNVLNNLQAQQNMILGELNDLAALDLLLNPPPLGYSTSEQQEIQAADLKYPFNQSTGETTLEQLEDLYGNDDQNVLIQYNTLFNDFGDNLNSELTAVQGAIDAVNTELANLQGTTDSAWDDTSVPAYVITGGDGNDTIYGSAERDVIDGGAGSDKIYWSPGNDAIFGGTDPGSTTEDLSTDTFAVQGTNQADTIDVWSIPGSGVYVKFKNKDTLGSLLAPDLNLEVDKLGIEKVEVDGLGGDDYITVATGADAYLQVEVDGGDGNDYINAGGTAGIMPGDADPDHANLLPAATNVTLVGGAGNDTLIAGSGGEYQSNGQTFRTVLYGGNDTGNNQPDVSLAPGVTDNDSLVGGSGIGEILSGGVGDDTVVTGTGAADTLDGGSGTNTLIVQGTAGNDTLEAGPGQVEIDGATSTWTNFTYLTMQGGAGDDTLIVSVAPLPSYSATSTLPLISIDGGPGTNSLVLQGDNNGDTLDLSQSGSIVFVNGAVSATATNVANVSAVGGTGNDLLDASGMTMGVTLDGGGGTDTLRGGAGDDTFYYSDSNGNYDGGGGANNRIIYREGGSTDAMIVYTDSFYDQTQDRYHDIGSITNVQSYQIDDKTVVPQSVARGDDSFANDDWTEKQVANPLANFSAYSSGSYSAGQASGGMWGTYLSQSDTIPAGNLGQVSVTHFFNNFVYSPSTQGAITQLTFAFDFDLFSLSANTVFAVAVAVLQGGNLYTGWDEFAGSGLAVGSWNLYSGPSTASQFSSPYIPGVPTTHPDFSIYGAPMEFGLLTAFWTSTTPGGTVRDSLGIDNFSAQVQNGNTQLVWPADAPIKVQTPAQLASSSTDAFGNAVALSGNNLLVGAPRAANNSGAAYLYDASSGDLLQVFKDPNAQTGDYFGSAVALSGNTVVVGAYNTGSNDTGAVYLFDATTGNLLLTLQPPSSAQDYYFGTAVAISGDNLVVGADEENWTGSNFAGTAYLYAASTGQLLQTFQNPDQVNEANFGVSVGISGNNIVVGAEGAYVYDLNTGNYSFANGAAYLFDASSGNLLQTFAGSDSVFGTTVAVSDSAVTVGDWQAAGAYVYDPATGNLIQALQDPAPQTDDAFGIAVAESGSNILVGASNGVYLFDANSGNLLQTYLAPSGVGVSQAYIPAGIGLPLAISGNQVLAGVALRGMLISMMRVVAPCCRGTKIRRPPIHPRLLPTLPTPISTRWSARIQRPSTGGTGPLQPGPLPPRAGAAATAP